MVSSAGTNIFISFYLILNEFVTKNLISNLSPSPPANCSFIYLFSHTICNFSYFLIYLGALFVPFLMTEGYRDCSQRSQTWQYHRIFWMFLASLFSFYPDEKVGTIEKFSPFQIIICLNTATHYLETTFKHESLAYIYLQIKQS